MTFEREYGKWLVGSLNKKTVELCGVTCKQYDDVAFKPLRKKTEQVAVIINGGGAARSAVLGMDQNNATFSVVLLCHNVYKNFALAAIESVQKEFNAKVCQFAYNDGAEQITQSVKSVFFTPVVLDESDYPTDTENGTIKAVFMMFNVAVAYGTTAVITPSEFTLKIDGKGYKIERLIQYNCASQPTYDVFLAQGDPRAKKNVLSANNAYVFTIAKSEGGAWGGLQGWLHDEINAQSGLYGKTLVLSRDGVDIPIREYQLTESYVDNAAAYVLTLIY